MQQLLTFVALSMARDKCHCPKSEVKLDGVNVALPSHGVWEHSLPVLGSITHIDLMWVMSQDASSHCEEPSRATHKLIY